MEKRRVWRACFRDRTKAGSCEAFAKNEPSRLSWWKPDFSSSERPIRSRQVKSYQQAAKPHGHHYWRREESVPTRCGFARINVTPKKGGNTGPLECKLASFKGSSNLGKKLWITDSFSRPPIAINSAPAGAKSHPRPLLSGESTDARTAQTHSSFILPAFISPSPTPPPNCHGGRRPRVLRPGMLGIARPQLPPHLLIRGPPEAA